jgi:hypothetical protein
MQVFAAPLRLYITGRTLRRPSGGPGSQRPTARETSLDIGGSMKRAIFAVALGLSLTVAACDSTAPSGVSPTAPSTVAGAAAAHAHHGASTGASPARAELKMTPEVSQQLDELRRMTAPFHNFDQAVAAGYSIPAPAAGVCISDPIRGGMGFHYTNANKDLINDGVVNLLEPEFLVYAPKDNGGVKFAALDYFVPYNTWTQAAPPSLLGVDFQREDGFQAYVMHIWLYWHNPAGIFQNYNPSVPQC